LIKESLEQNQVNTNQQNTTNQQITTNQNNNFNNMQNNPSNSIQNQSNATNGDNFYLPSVPNTTNKSNSTSRDLIDLNRGGIIENPILKLTSIFSTNSNQNESCKGEQEDPRKNEIKQFIPLQFHNDTSNDFKKTKISDQIKLPPKESFLFANHPSLQSENYSFNNNIVLLNTLFSSNTHLNNKESNSSGDLEKISSEMLKERLSFLQKKKKSSFEMYR
jgi:hypothetical protein